jgi:hypothetical protein
MKTMTISFFSLKATKFEKRALIKVLLFLILHDLF